MLYEQQEFILEVTNLKYSRFLPSEAFGWLSMTCGPTCSAYCHQAVPFPWSELDGESKFRFASVTHVRFPNTGTCFPNTRHHFNTTRTTSLMTVVSAGGHVRSLARAVGFENMEAPPSTVDTNNTKVLNDLHTIAVREKWQIIETNANEYPPPPRRGCAKKLGFVSHLGGSGSGRGLDTPKAKHVVYEETDTQFFHSKFKKEIPFL